MDRIREKSGTTMVEVIVAFTVLLLIMGIFSQSVTMTGRMMGRSNDTLVASRNLAGDYYMEQITPETKPVTLRFKEVNMGAFELSAILRKFENSAGALYDVTVD